jgi:hypothetical protein
MSHASAFWVLNQVRLKNPHAQVQGLWHENGEYIVVVSNISTAVACDGNPLEHWFRNHRPLHLRIRLASEVPLGWKQVQEQTLEQFLQPVAPLRSVRSVVADLCLALPKDFPSFDLVLDPTQIVVARPLDDEEHAQLDLNQALFWH